MASSAWLVAVKERSSAGDLAERKRGELPPLVALECPVGQSRPLTFLIFNECPRPGRHQTRPHGRRYEYLHENPARVLGAGATPAPSSASRGQIGALKALSLVRRGQCTHEVGTYRHCQRWWGPLRSPPFRPCQRGRPEGKSPSTGRWTTGPQRLRRHLLPAKTAHYYASTSRLPPPNPFRK